MRRTAITTLLAGLLLAGPLTGCGSKSASSPEERASDSALVDAEADGSPRAEQELEQRSEELQAGGEAGFAWGDGTANADKRDDLVMRMQDRAFDRLFKKGPVDKALDRLPLRKGPLDVLQWVTTDLTKPLSGAERERFYGMSAQARAKRLAPKVSHKVYARVDRRRWYRMSKRARGAAVGAFYRQAEKQFEKKGIRDFVLVVTPISPTTEHLPALAIGRGGSAALTPLGENGPDNGV